MINYNLRGVTSFLNNDLLRHTMKVHYEDIISGERENEVLVPWNKSKKTSAVSQKE